jgi:hypothetical protein
LRGGFLGFFGSSDLPFSSGETNCTSARIAQARAFWSLSMA